MFGAPDDDFEAVCANGCPYGYAGRHKSSCAEARPPKVDIQGFKVKDSGSKSVYEDGMQRDATEGKPRFDLIFPRDIPYEDQLMTRVAMQYERGGQKYGARNWEKSSSEESLAHHEAALMRHVVKYLTGEQDGEDHAAAVVWNVNAVELTRRKVRLKKDQHAKAWGADAASAEVNLLRKELNELRDYKEEREVEDDTHAYWLNEHDSFVDSLDTGAPREEGR